MQRRFPTTYHAACWEDFFFGKGAERHQSLTVFQLPNRAEHRIGNPPIPGALLTPP